MVQGPDPNRAQAGDDGYAADEPGDDRAARFGLTSGSIVVLILLITAAFLAVVIF